MSKGQLNDSYISITGGGALYKYNLEDSSSSDKSRFNSPQSDRTRSGNPNFKNTSFRRKVLVSGIIAVLCLSAVFAFLQLVKSPAKMYAFSGGNGQSGTPFEIANLPDLTELRNNVNNGTTYAGYYFKLTGNISVGTWTPIGNASNRVFQGHFDGNRGNGFAITGLSSTTGGLFGYTGSGSITNLKLTVSSISFTGAAGSNGVYTTSYTQPDTPATKGEDVTAGGLVNNVSGTTITNCDLTVNMNVTGGTGGIGTSAYISSGGGSYSADPGAVGGVAYVGGIAGYGSGARITNCKVTGTIIGKGGNGGRGGGGSGGSASGGNGADSYVGYIAGYLIGSSTITAPSNGSININGSAGGIGGKKSGSNASKVDGANGTLYHNVYVGNTGGYTIINTVTVTYDANGGAFDESIATKTKDHSPGAAYQSFVSPSPTRKYYIFAGWFTSLENANGTDASGQVVESSIVPNSTHTLYARWISNTAVVTFDLNGSGATVGLSSKAVVHGKSYGVLPTPERVGYKFGGWFTSATSANLNVAADKVTNVTKVTVLGAHTLYARWVA